MTSTPRDEDNDVLPTARQRRAAEREARRQAKDEAYDERLARKKSKDVHFLHGHHVVNAQGLAEAFPEPETPEYDAGIVRRRVIHGVTLVLLLALVVAGLVLAGMVQRGELVLNFGIQKPAAPVVTCPTEKLDYPANKTVTVSVYNAGGAEGLAGRIAAELKKRGYKTKDVDNATTEYLAPAIVVSGPSGHAAAFNLQRNLIGSDFVEDDRKDASVDVILTTGFAQLVEAKKVDQTPGKLSCPRLEPTPGPTGAVGTPAATGRPPAKK